MKIFQIFPKKYGFFPYVFLIYLVMPLLYVKEEKGMKAVIGYSLLLLFLITYRQLYWLMEQKKYSYWLILQVSIIVIFSIWYNPNNLFMGFFPANFIGWYENKKYFNRAIIFFAAAILLTYILSIQKAETSMIYFLPFFVVMLISPFGIRSMNKRMELEKQLDQANEQIKDLIKREERVRIARDLHDTLGHTLSLITLQSQLVQRLAEKDPERAKAEAKGIEMTSRSALRQVRELVSEMRAIMIAEELLEMEKILKAAGIDFHSEAESEFSDVPLLQQNILGMCLREAATNIVKHSKAKNCIFTFRKSAGHFMIEVKDDGIGFTDDHHGGNGWKGMRERLSLIEGELAIHSIHGTTLTFSVPIVMKQEKEGIA